MRDWLIQFLLTSPLLCWFGLHIPLHTVEFDDETSKLLPVGSHCGACEKVL